jgi:4-hydroxy-3-methylbut-2-enyl diphosphate reductase
MVKVEIDSRSGFCGGVIRAISQAERFLQESDHLYSLGAIVHNEAELDRLGAEGLRTVASIPDVPEGETVLIRAHGEPPATYAAARRRGLTVIDCTCPVVLKLQEHIREAYVRLHADGRRGTLLIFGKIGHAEVLGLLGQVDGDAIVVENRAMLEEVLPRIDFSQPVEIFSQTTKSPSEYAEICDRVRSLTEDVTVHDTICAQVANRHEHLEAFARAHDLILFVAGESSSNGRVLFDLCRRVNPRSHRIGSVSDIDPSWIQDGDRVGICGATSTPKWLLEEVAAAAREA